MPFTGPVTVVGAGRVGSALGSNLLELGHSVRFAVRDVAGAQLLARTSAVSVDGAASGSELVVLAVPFPALAEVVPRLGLTSGQVLVDATNPFGVTTGDHPSGAAAVVSLAGEGVAVVKAFNVLGAEHMATPPLPDGHRPLLPVASDHAAARRDVAALASAMGFDVVDVGGLETASVLEEAARYWGLVAFAEGRSRHVVLVAHERP